MKRRTNPAMKRRSNKELIGRFPTPSEPRSHPLLDDTVRFDPVTTFWTERLRERARGLQAKNAERRRKAERDYQKYRDIAEVLIAGNPQLRRATRHRLAKAVQAELRNQGRGVVSARTIWEALRLKNKV